MSNQLIKVENLKTYFYTDAFVGIIFLMIGFGSAFGNTVMGHVALLIERMDFLLSKWLHILWK